MGRRRSEINMLETYQAMTYTFIDSETLFLSAL